MSGFTPMIEQYRSIKKEYADCILFFRLGDFYEMFFEDAEVASRELDIVLTARRWTAQDSHVRSTVSFSQHLYKTASDRGFRLAI